MTPKKPKAKGGSEMSKLTELLDRLDSLEAKATPTPWIYHEHHTLHDGPVIDHPPGMFIASAASDDAGDGKKDAALIAALRNEYRTIASVLRTYEEALRTLRIAVNDKQPDPGAVAFIDKALASAERALEGVGG
jgi:phytoene dehydrogenase-like protein